MEIESPPKAPLNAQIVRLVHKAEQAAKRVDAGQGKGSGKMCAREQRAFSHGSILAP